MTDKINEEKTKQILALIDDEVNTESDLQLLSEYRSLFKKQISVFRRSWVSAYLLMQFNQNNLIAKIEKNRSINNNKISRNKKFDIDENNKADILNTNDKKSSENQYLLSEDESKYLFISIGRNRRVFAREILGLILSKTELPRKDIGSIRIMDNFSFVQVRDISANKIIETLNGFVFRGRTLNIDYAKPRNQDSDNNELSENNEE